MKTNIGIQEIETPKDTCTDRNCPFHGTLSVRGRMFKGKIVSNKMDKSVVVSWERIIRYPKFERYMRKRSKVSAHLPPCIKVNTGDEVFIMETKPISKTKKFVVIKNFSFSPEVKNK